MTSEQWLLLLIPLSLAQVLDQCNEQIIDRNVNSSEF